MAMKKGLVSLRLKIRTMMFMCRQRALILLWTVIPLKSVSSVKHAQTIRVDQKAKSLRLLNAA
ncbi:Uncharacterised protein [Mycobacteroides abscessus subsp. abscessus]|nr:Uncharacterised protein [Mycobacteroides abscessus subsp. abscessus]